MKTRLCSSRKAKQMLSQMMPASLLFSSHISKDWGKSCHPHLIVPHYLHLVLTPFSPAAHPLAAGGIPMQMKYWKVSMQARKKQYLGQISAMAFLLRRYMTMIKAKP
ncbi:hypothetical protein EYF80_001273 [Liparis tanakae]|uniref:Uncharacterized protein n=1 Tax=Liparis tanakae TaxID=230148 RepID=A0A4Z2JE75_9TELE|nr:hypothetical protein EYF80_001273 [Liparis tanakae]